MRLLPDVWRYLLSWPKRQMQRRQCAQRLQQLTAAGDDLRKTWKQLTPFNGFIARRRQDLENEFHGFRKSLLAAFPDSPESLQDPERRLERLTAQFFELRALSDKWQAKADAIRLALDQALEASASIRGRPFQTACSRDRRLAEKCLADSRKTRDRAESYNHLIEAQKHCDILKVRVEKAIQVRVVLPQFLHNLETFDVAGVVGDAGLERAYRLIRETADSANNRLKDGQYESAALKLEEGGREFGQLQTTVQFRFHLVQKEVDLWRSDPAVWEKFYLDRFNAVSSARQIGEWQETKPALALYVNNLAIRSASANLSTWPEQNWSCEEIEKFSLAVVAATSQHKPLA